MHELWFFAVAGLAAGGAYSLTAVGVVTVYRGSGVLNFAHTAIGMAGTYIFWECFDNGGHSLLSLGVAPTMAVGVLGGGLIGLIVYLAVMYPMRRASELARVIATLGVLLLLQNIALLMYSSEAVVVPRFLGTGLTLVWGAPIRHDTLWVIGATLVLAAGLSLLFRKTRLGLSATALQVRPVAASAIGISPHPTGMAVWGLGGALAAAAGIFVVPTIGLSPSQLTLLINFAFAAALLGRFHNYPVTIAAGMLMGVGVSVMVGYEVPGWIQLSTPFVVIIVALVIGGSAVPGRGFAEARMPSVGTGVPRWGWIAGFFVAIFLILTVVLGSSGTDQGWHIAFHSATIAALASLSIVIVTGYAGQVSLATFGVMGMAALLAARASGTWNLGSGISILFGIGAGALTGFLIGLPAVRVRGIDLTVATLGAGLMISGAVLTWPGFAYDKGIAGSGGLHVSAMRVLGMSFEPARHPERFSLLCLALLTLTCLGIANLRRSRAGRRLLAVRANERGAAAIGISVGGAKVAAFTLGGAVAGLAGALFTFRTSSVSFNNFDVFRSIFQLAFTLVGGVGFVLGALYAGAITLGGPFAYVFSGGVFRVSTEFDKWLAIGSGVLVIQIMLQSPEGIISLVGHQTAGLRSRLTRGLCALHLAGSLGGARPTFIPPAEIRPVAQVGTLQLTVEGLTVDYGAVRAVDGVNLEVAAGRILGVIGPNGAGKTTLIDCITGFAREMQGASCSTDATSHAGRSGGARVKALDVPSRTSSSSRISRCARTCLPQATRVISWRLPRAGCIQGQWCCAIRPRRRSPCSILVRCWTSASLTCRRGHNGSSRIARAVAARPKVVCLDEPAAGLGEQERAAMAAAIRTLVSQLHLGVLIVEHNIDVVSGLCDDIVVLDFGAVIASGDPADVLRSDVVRSAYLGTSGGGFGNAAISVGGMPA